MSASAIISIISALLSIVRYFIDYAKKRQMVDDITAQIVLQATRDSDDAIAKAKKARDAVRANNQRDPDSILRDDDGYKRPD